jgi:hypothetical protein
MIREFINRKRRAVRQPPTRVDMTFEKRIIAKPLLLLLLPYTLYTIYKVYTLKNHFDCLGPKKKMFRHLQSFVMQPNDRKEKRNTVRSDVRIILSLSIRTAYSF